VAADLIGRQADSGPLEDFGSGGILNVLTSSVDEFGDLLVLGMVGELRDTATGTRAAVEG
jgi:hypothetical protein